MTVQPGLNQIWSESLKAGSHDKAHVRNTFSLSLNKVVPGKTTGKSPVSGSICEVFMFCWL